MLIDLIGFFSIGLVAFRALHYFHINEDVRWVVDGAVCGGVWLLWGGGLPTNSQREKMRRGGNPADEPTGGGAGKLRSDDRRLGALPPYPQDI